jgi:hypothetical protein
VQHLVTYSPVLKLTQFDVRLNLGLTVLKA